MIRRFIAVLTVLLFTLPLFAQTETSDIEHRLKALEEKVAEMQRAAASPALDEIRREIDVLTKEIESIRNQQQKPAAVAQADSQQYGLGAAASKVYRAEQGVSFGGYGEFLYQKPNRGEAATANLERAVLYTGYKFNDRALFNSELEVEGASTERHGAVSVEFAYLDYLIRPELNVRAGVVLMPVGLINEQHEPTAYFGARRPRTEHDIIPATWGDMGAGIFGDVGRVSYRAYLTTGLDAAGFGAEEGIREGRQAGAGALANDWALTARADFHPFEGTMLGGSLYDGNSGHDRGLKARVTLGEVHADAKFRGASLRGLWSRGRIGDAAAVNALAGLDGSQSVGSSFGGWYVEGGYDLATLTGWSFGLTPYFRYEQLDTQRSVPAGYLRDPEHQQKIATFGFAFKPIAQTVVKADYERHSNKARTATNQFNVSLGYIF